MGPSRWSLTSRARAQRQRRLTLFTLSNPPRVPKKKKLLTPPPPQILERLPARDVASAGASCSLLRSAAYEGPFAASLWEGRARAALGTFAAALQRLDVPSEGEAARAGPGAAATAAAAARNTKEPVTEPLGSAGELLATGGAGGGKGGGGAEEGRDHRDEDRFSAADAAAAGARARAAAATRRALRWAAATRGAHSMSEGGLRWSKKVALGLQAAVEQEEARETASDNGGARAEAGAPPQPLPSRPAMPRPPLRRALARSGHAATPVVAVAVSECEHGKRAGGKRTRARLVVTGGVSRDGGTRGDIDVLVVDAGSDSECDSSNSPSNSSSDSSPLLPRVTRPRVGTWRDDEGEGAGGGGEEGGGSYSAHNDGNNSNASSSSPPPRYVPRARFRHAAVALDLFAHCPLAADALVAAGAARDLEDLRRRDGDAVLIFGGYAADGTEFGDSGSLDVMWVDKRGSRATWAPLRTLPEEARGRQRQQQQQQPQQPDGGGGGGGFPAARFHHSAELFLSRGGGGKGGQQRRPCVVVLGGEGAGVRASDSGGGDGDAFAVSRSDFDDDDDGDAFAASAGATNASAPSPSSSSHPPCPTTAWVLDLISLTWQRRRTRPDPRVASGLAGLYFLGGAGTTPAAAATARAAVAAARARAHPWPRALHLSTTRHCPRTGSPQLVVLGGYRTTAAGDENDGGGGGTGGDARGAVAAAAFRGGGGGFDGPGVLQSLAPWALDLSTWQWHAGPAALREARAAVERAASAAAAAAAGSSASAAAAGGCGGGASFGQVFPLGRPAAAASDAAAAASAAADASAAAEWWCPPARQRAGAWRLGCDVVCGETQDCDDDDERKGDDGAAAEKRKGKPGSRPLAPAASPTPLADAAPWLVVSGGSPAAGGGFFGDAHALHLPTLAWKRGDGGNEAPSLAPSSSLPPLGSSSGLSAPSCSRLLVQGRPTGPARIAGHSLSGGLAFGGCIPTLAGVVPVAKMDVLSFFGGGGLPKSPLPPPPPSSHPPSPSSSRPGSTIAAIEAGYAGVAGEAAGAPGSRTRSPARAAAATAAMAAAAAARAGGANALSSSSSPPRPSPPGPGTTPLSSSGSLLVSDGTTFRVWRDAATGRLYGERTGEEERATGGAAFVGAAPASASPPSERFDAPLSFSSSSPAPDLPSLPAFERLRLSSSAIESGDDFDGEEDSGDEEDDDEFVAAASAAAAAAAAAAAVASESGDVVIATANAAAAAAAAAAVDAPVGGGGESSRGSEEEEEQENDDEDGDDGESASSDYSDDGDDTDDDDNEGHAGGAFAALGRCVLS